ncbi:MAG TPA: hypothetical protein VFX16_31875 [Pseudonocardiaceae bacterium]|nr:hypothetical protein [Pseudonocardiaceae bacterium]
MDDVFAALRRLFADLCVERLAVTIRLTMTTSGSFLARVEAGIADRIDARRKSAVLAGVGHRQRSDEQHE